MPLSSDSKFSRFFRGFSVPLRALELIFTRPNLMALSLLPVLLTLLLVASVIYACLAGAWAQGNNLFQNWMGNQTWIASGFLVVIAALLVLYFLFHAFSILLSLVSSPFNDLLSEASEKALQSSYPKLGIFDLVRVFFLDLRKTVLTLFFAGVFGCLSFVPLLGILSVVGFAFIQALTFITYPQSRRKQGVLQSLTWLKLHWEASLGFGLACLILFGVPVLNLFALPLSVVGGTLLFLENDKSEPSFRGRDSYSDGSLSIKT